DAGAANSGDQDAARAVEGGKRRLRQDFEQGDVASPWLRLAAACPELAAMHGNEARAEPFHTGIILVADRLVDHALATELRLDRCDRDAVRLHAAIAAALADELVDEHPLGRIRIEAALAPPPLLGRAGLIIDQDADALDFHQLALDGIELVTMVERDPVGKAGIARILVGLIGDNRDAPYALCRHLACDHGDREAALVGLATSHGDSVVVKDLVGDVDAGGHAGANREQAGVIVGSVAEVLEHVAAFREWRLADPVGALGAHVGCPLGQPFRYELDHPVTTDAGVAAAAVWNDRRRVVRASGTEIGGATGELRSVRQRGAGCLQRRYASGDAFVAATAEDAATDLDRDMIRFEDTERREQRVPRLVELADYGGSITAAVELFAHLRLDERALFFHHDDEIEAFGEPVDDRRIERPHHADLEQADTQLRGSNLV